jgi:hypothetical protein
MLWIILTERFRGSKVCRKGSRGRSGLRFIAPVGEVFLETVQVTATGIPNRGEMRIQEVWKNEDFSGRKLG